MQITRITLLTINVSQSCLLLETSHFNISLEGAVKESGKVTARQKENAYRLKETEQRS